MASLFVSLGRSLVKLLIALPVIIGLSISSPAMAAQWDAETLTVPVSPGGQQVTFSEADIKAGSKLFKGNCGTCHNAGITKTNQNVGLDPETLALATPARDNVDALVTFMKDPSSFDGEYSIADTHPSTSSSDIFVQMRNLNDDELSQIAGYILTAPKVMGPNQWGGGKIYF